MQTAHTRFHGELPVLKYKGNTALLDHPKKGPLWFVFTAGDYESMGVSPCRTCNQTRPQSELLDGQCRPCWSRSKEEESNCNQTGSSSSPSPR